MLRAGLETPGTRTRSSLRTALLGLVYLLLATASALGLFQRLDAVVRDTRFAMGTIAPTGSIVFVDIDSRSLATVGVWPWPRSVYAKVLDRLMQLGAGDVVFDVDFSAASREDEDRILAKSLEAAGGYAYLGAFYQMRAPAAAREVNLPLPLFRQYAPPVSVNVAVDEAGIARQYPYALPFGGEKVPSAAAVLANSDGPLDAGFSIDFSIDAQAIDRVSVADLLADSVAKDRIEGRQVVIGASAVELRDIFLVPRHGMVPGAILQILAAETLKLGRALQPAPWWPASLAIVLVGLIAIRGRRLSLPVTTAVAVLVSGSAEAAALVAQQNAALLVDTVAVHISTVVLASAAVAGEMVKRGIDHQRAARERDMIRRVLDRVVTDNFDGVIVVDETGRIITISDAGRAILGVDLAGQEADALPGTLHRAIQRCLGGDDAGGPAEMVLAAGSGERVIEYVVRRSDVELAKGPSPVVCLTFRDITERRRAEERLLYLGNHDRLTGALSRSRLVELIDEQAAAAKADLALVLVDLRRFRIINDTLGHDQGDALLKQVALRLKGMGPDAVARLGGDSFAMLVPGGQSRDLRGYCQAVVQWLSFPYDLKGGHRAIIAASAGATTSSVSGASAEALLSHADMALSLARQSAGNGVELFQPEMDDRLRGKQALDSALRVALTNRQFKLAYQPQVKIPDGELTGAEVLLRWHDSELGEVAPTQFIPAAEETGLVVELGRWVLEEACFEAVNWPSHLQVAVNVSPIQFELSDIVSDVRTALAKSGLAPHRLEIEVTEGVMVTDLAAVIRTLSELRELGVHVAIDDFGTGFSSLSYLGQLPIDRIKIDKSFVKRLSSDPQAAAIAQAVVSISRSIGASIIAEGVEDADQAWMLQILGCDEAQGYHFGRPMPAEAFRRSIGAAPRQADVA